MGAEMCIRGRVWRGRPGRVFGAEGGAFAVGLPFVREGPVCETRAVDPQRRPHLEDAMLRTRRWLPLLLSLAAALSPAVAFALGKVAAEEGYEFAAHRVEALGAVHGDHGDAIRALFKKDVSHRGLFRREGRIGANSGGLAGRWQPPGRKQAPECSGAC